MLLYQSPLKYLKEIEKNGIENKIDSIAESQMYLP